MTEEMFRRYSNIIVFGPFTALVEEDLDRAEQEIGHPLPGEYRQFLLIANGGRLEYEISLPPNDAAGTPIVFDALESGQKLVKAWRNHQENAEMSGFPPGLLPVAYEAGGSTLYLDLRPETHGQVLAFVHGLPQWAGGDNRDSFGPVAANWNEYLESLELSEDIAEMAWEDVDPDDDSPEGQVWKEAVVTWLDAGLPNWREQEWAD